MLPICGLSAVRSCRAIYTRGELCPAVQSEVIIVILRGNAKGNMKDYSMQLDQPIHSGRVDWLPANPERGDIRTSWYTIKT